MNSFLMRLLLVASLSCGFLGSKVGVESQAILNDGTDGKEQVRQFDGWLKQVAEEPQIPVTTAIQTSTSPNRVVSSRSSRLLPTQGGRPGHHHGRWTANGYGLLSTSPRGEFAKSSHAPGWTSASPRLYYVIALRRLLC